MIEYKTKLNKISLVREATEIPRVKIKSSRDTAEYARTLYGDDLTLYESFFVIFLNNANNTIGYSKISQGGITGTMVDVRIVAKYSLEALATGVILVHNHPSGTMIPSTSDKQITSKIKNGLDLLDIKVLDHIILTEDNYYSFSDDGIL